LARVYFVVLRVDRRGTTTTTGMERGKKETVGGGISMAVSPSADVRGGADRVVVGGAPALTTSKRGKGGIMGCVQGGDLKISEVVGRNRAIALDRWLVGSYQSSAPFLSEGGCPSALVIIPDTHTHSHLICVSPCIIQNLDGWIRWKPSPPRCIY
jgi:hypothetical protein